MEFTIEFLCCSLLACALLFYMITVPMAVKMVIKEHRQIKRIEEEERIKKEERERERKRLLNAWKRFKESEKRHLDLGDIPLPSGLWINNPNRLCIYEQFIKNKKVKVKE